MVVATGVSVRTTKLRQCLIPSTFNVGGILLRYKYMNPLRIINRGHQNLVEALKDLEPEGWTTGFVTGDWTVKDVVNHLAASEGLQIEALQKLMNSQVSTPMLDQKDKDGLQGFNKANWEQAQSESQDQVWNKYLNAYNQLENVLKSLPAELLSKPETLKWYGEMWSVDDVIALNFGHKKHHIAQIKQFRQRDKK